MNNSCYVRSAIAATVLELLPPLIRKTLLDESEFRKEYDLGTQAEITFGDSGVSIHSSELFDSIRNVLSGASERKVSDTNGLMWTLRDEADHGELPKLVLSSAGPQLVPPNCAVLSTDSAIRLRSLEQAACDVNLAANARDAWRHILTDRALEDDEFTAFYSDCCDTPVHVMRFIRDEIRTGRSSVLSLVPRSRKYFERLVGTYDGSASIGDYAVGAGRTLFEQLAAWRPYEGFMLSLCLSSHAALTAEIGIEHLGSEELVRAFEFLESHGDRISQLGAIEVGLRILPERRELEPLLVRLVEQIRDDDVDDSMRGVKLYSALFVLVDGELSRTRLMSAEPPFYRRLASLSQAALIQRQFVNSGVDAKFYEWALMNRGQQYYMQSFADMRLEPRWDPALAAADHFKAEFIGRILIAGKRYEANIKDSGLYDLIVGAGRSSLHSVCEFPHPYLPGPLEGSQVGANTMPTDLSKAIEAQLNAESVGPYSFVALVNSAMIGLVDSDHVTLAARVLKLGNYRLANVEGKSQLLSILSGLATVAATGRNVTLADELRILLRTYRRDAQYGLPIEEVTRICLVASASRKDMHEWRDFVGEWLTELSMWELEGDEGVVLHSYLRCLCHAVPELWVSCGKADAALMALNDR